MDEKEFNQKSAVYWDREVYEWLADEMFRREMSRSRIVMACLQWVKSTGQLNAAIKNADDA